MPSTHHVRRLAMCLAITLALPGCDLEDLAQLPSRADVDIFNESDVAANIMAPGETASADNLVQPAEGRVASVLFEPGGAVTFRATNDQGLFLLATRTFVDNFAAGVSGVTGEVVLTNDPSFVCRGDLFPGG